MVEGLLCAILVFLVMIFLSLECMRDNAKDILQYLTRIGTQGIDNKIRERLKIKRKRAE